jgi:PilZ domain-containing protein
MSISPLPKDLNRRATPRRAIRAEASVLYGDTSRRVQTWDLGRDGMCLVSDRPIAPGTRCKVTFDVPLGGETVNVTAAAKIVYSSYSAAGEFKIGAVFTGLAEDVALVLGRFAALA